jgi:hypothetical protein
MYRLTARRTAALAVSGLAALVAGSGTAGRGIRPWIGPSGRPLALPDKPGSDVPGIAAARVRVRP